MMSGEKDLSLFSIRLTFEKSVRPCAFNDTIFMLVGISWFHSCFSDRERLWLVCMLYT